MTDTKTISTRSGGLILVNARHPYAGNLNESNLKAVGGEHSGVFMERRAAALLEGLMEEIHGWRYIAPVSGWRSSAGQQKIWNECLRDEGEEFTRKYVALPGCSEHQTGLAIDLGIRSENIDFIRPQFPTDGVCGEFRRRAADYGFILRYPAGKEHITGIASEPWHFRCVGIPHAAVMTEKNLCLEEYHEYLRQNHPPESPLEYASGKFLFSVFSTFQIPADTGERSMVSGDNHGGYIITVWREGESI